MSVFSVPVTIGVDEERIAEEISGNVERQVVKTITEEVKKKMYSQSYYHDDPLNTMIKNEVSKIIDNHKEQIIENASKLLCERLSRTKAAKEAVGSVLDTI